MTRAVSAMRAKLKGGNVVVGSALFSWSVNAVDAAGAARLDFVRFDSETSWRRDSSMEDMVRAALSNDLAPIVRVDKGDPALVRKALEIGAYGVMVPDIRSVEDARAVVAAAKFPPYGTRGYSSNCYSAGWGDNGGADWVHWSNTEPLIGIVIEHPQAVEAVADIVAVDGIDFVQFGATDLAMTLGLGAPDPKHPDVQRAMQRTFAATRAAGRHIFANVPADADAVRRHMDFGVTMLELSNDIGILRSAWRSARKAADQ